MSDLHLTDAQVAELKTIKPMGLAAAYELLCWREASRSPWTIWDDSEDEQRILIRAGDGSDGLLLFNLYRWPHIPESGDAVRADAQAAIFSRNTAELRAAAIYWQHMSDIQPYASDAAKYRSSHWQKLQEKLSTITEALQSLCQGTPQAGVS